MTGRFRLVAALVGYRLATLWLPFGNQRMFPEYPDRRQSAAWFHATNPTRALVTPQVDAAGLCVGEIAAE